MSVAEASLEPQRPSSAEPLFDVEPESDLDGCAEGLDETISLYLREVARVPLLTAAEERRLSGLARAGDPVAYRQLVQSNLRLAVSLARKATGYGVPLLDLIQEGNVGLMRAARLFDPGRGVRFSTYATWWIRQAIGRAVIDQARAIRLPPPLHDLDVRVRRTQARLNGELGREATLAEVASTLQVPLRKLETLLIWTRPVGSLQAPMGEDGEDALLQGLLTDPDAPDPGESVLERALREEIDALLCALTPRERRVIAARFGLNGQAPQTLERIGRSLGVTRQRVQQIEEEAMEKLRRSSRCAALREFA